MNQPSPDERELVLSALRDIAGLLDAGKCSEVIARYNRACPKSPQFGTALIAVFLAASDMTVTIRL